MNITTKTTLENVYAHTTKELRSFLQSMADQGKSTLSSTQIRKAVKSQLIQWAWAIVEREQIRLKNAERKAELEKAKEWDQNHVVAAFEAFIEGLDNVLVHLEDEAKDLLNNFQGATPSHMDRLASAHRLFRYKARNVDDILSRFTVTKQASQFVHHQYKDGEMSVDEVVQAFFDQAKDYTRRIMRHTILNDDDGAKLNEMQFAVHFNQKAGEFLLEALEAAKNLETEADYDKFYCGFRTKMSMLRYAAS